MMDGVVVRYIKQIMFCGALSLLLSLSGHLRKVNERMRFVLF